MMRRRLATAALVLVAIAVGSGVDDGYAQPRHTVVRLPLPQYDGTLTPYTFELAYPLVTLVYDTLMWRDAMGVPQPWLAQSVSRENGGRTYTVRLRKGVRWHDGRPLTAADVAFTFDFVARRFHPRFTPQLSDISRVVAVDRRTVRFELRLPSLGFLDQPLADVPILPRHLWQGLAAGAVPRGRPVGTGPYRLTRIGRARGYVFRANPNYFKGRPRVDTIRVPIIRQEARTYRALQQRRVDMLPVPLPVAATKRLGAAFGINIRRGPSYSGTALVLNVRRPPFDRPATRRAVAQAIDLGRIIKNVGPGAAAEQGYVHPDSTWAPRTRLHQVDVPAARRVFEAADLPTIRVLAPNNDPVRREAGRQVALALRRAGAKAEMVEVSRARLGHAIGEDGSPANFDAAITTTPPLASDDPDFLRRVFGSDPRNAPLNFSGYRSPEFETLAGRVASAPTRRARRSAVTSELRLLATDAPEVPLFFSEGRFAYRPAIHDGWVFVKGAGIFDKRSFLAGGPSSSSPPESQGGDEGSTDDSTSFLDVLQVASLVVLAIVLLLGGAALMQRLRSGRS
jgi:peptide/nickel transport system substrate-binding protein